ncbi:hypothetical protein BDV3_001226 [Batrachochytrium dendrobatidis]|nr:hypothetical protein O5D80_005744 [Batrachochytrium dendrobatidis]
MFNQRFNAGALSDITELYGYTTRNNNLTTNAQLENTHLLSELPNPFTTPSWRIPAKSDSLPSTVLHSKKTIEKLLKLNLNMQDILDKQLNILMDQENQIRVQIKQVRSQFSSKLLKRRRQTYRLRISEPYIMNNEKEAPPPDHELWNADPLIRKCDVAYDLPVWTRRECEQLEKAIYHHNEMKMYDINIRSVSATKEQLLANVTDINWDQIARHVGTKTRQECKKMWTVAQHPFINNNPFTKLELECLEKVITKHAAQDWVAIACEHRYGRVAIQCFRAYRTLIAPANIGVSWSDTEDASLLQAIDKCIANDWQAVSKYLNGRSAKQCLQRFKFVVAPGKKKGRWSAAEDQALLKAVQRYGRGKWNYIAMAVGHRTDMQCRERYENCLNPDICRGPLTPEEERILSAAVAEHGSGKWSTISKCFTNRTDNICRRAWSIILKRKKKQHALLPPPPQIASPIIATDNVNTIDTIDSEHPGVKQIENLDKEDDDILPPRPKKAKRLRSISKKSVAATSKLAHVHPQKQNFCRSIRSKKPSKPK